MYIVYHYFWISITPFDDLQLDTQFLRADAADWGMDPFEKGYVRTIVMRFWKGQSKMNDVWDAEYNTTKANTTTGNATNLEEVSWANS